MPIGHTASPSSRDPLFTALDRLYYQALDALGEWGDRMSQLDDELIAACRLDSGSERILQVHPELAISPSEIFERFVRLGVGILFTRAGKDAPRELAEAIFQGWPTDMRTVGKVHRHTLAAQIAFAGECSIEEACLRILSTQGVADGRAEELAVNNILDALLAPGEEMIVLNEHKDASIFALRIVRSAGDLPWHLPHDQIERMARGTEGFATLAAVDGNLGLSHAISTVADILRSALSSNQNRYTAEDSWGQPGTFMVTLLRDTAEMRVSHRLASLFEAKVSSRPMPTPILRR